MKILRGAPKIFRHPKGGSEKIRGGSENCILQNQKDRGGSKKIEPLVRGAAKISNFEFQYLHPPPPPCHIK